VGERFVLLVGEVVEREGGAEATVRHRESELQLCDGEDKMGIAVLARALRIKCKLLPQVEVSLYVRRLNR
jgi:hypothetical protein